MGAHRTFFDPISTRLAEMSLAQRGMLLCWVPVSLAVGIGLYFSLRFEPPLLVFAALGVVALLLFCAAWTMSETAAPVPLALAFVLIGVILAGARAHNVAEPVLGWRYYGPIERPAVLIADAGALVGVMSPTGRGLSKAKGAGFVARNWLENDGDGSDQYLAAQRWHADDIVHLPGKRALAAFEGCVSPKIVIASVPVEKAFPNCTIFDPNKLRHTGAIALQQISGGFEVVTSRDISGNRLWTHWPKADFTEKPVQYVRISPTSRP